MKSARFAMAWIFMAALPMALPAQAQETIVHQKPVRLRHLEGTVVDPKGFVVDYAMIELRGTKDHKVLASTFADGNGKFYFAERKRGETLEIRVSKAGFNIAQYTVSIAVFGKEHLRIVLPAAV